jgi:DNA invertase Pin-like site-specific DNA recombinase
MNDIHERPTKPELTVAYVRTATADRRVTGLSLERQRQACEEYAHALGRRMSAIYADIGVSGLSEHRPALDQLMLDLARGHIRCVVMADPDRLARSRQVEQRLQQRVRSKGATISSPCDSTQVTNRKEEI